MSAPAPAIGPEKPEPPAEVGPLEALRMLRSARPAIFEQVALHAELLRVEWTEEKLRLRRLLIGYLLGVVVLLCGLQSVGALVLALTWDTAWRTPSVVALIVVSSAGLGVVWRRLHRLEQRGSEAFAATREELAATVDLLRSRL